MATKDGVLIARHEPNITATTDVAAHPEFANRRRTGVNVDGALEDGRFASDFTAAEIKTLRAVEPLPERSQRYDGKFRIPTLEQVIALVNRETRRAGRTIGIYPETEHPTYHKGLGLPVEGRWSRSCAMPASTTAMHVFIQSFEQANLKQLNRMTKVPLIQLVDANDVNPDGTLDYTAPFDRPYDWTVSGDPARTSRTFGFFATDAGLDEIRTYADGISPWKRYIVTTSAVDSNGDGTVGDENGDGRIDESDRVLLGPTNLIQRAHRRGLLVHTWTFRNEPRRLAADYRGIPVEEYLQFYELGIDGVFSDFPDTAVTARELLDPGEQ